MIRGSADEGAQRSFVGPHNCAGRIRPEDIVCAMTQFGPAESEVCLELSLHEREPADRSAAKVMRDSVGCWHPHLSV